MKKTIAVISAALVAAASFAAEYHWRGSAPDMTENGKSGSWSDISNWTDANGNAATDYPHVAGDIAVFHGMAMGGYVAIGDDDIIAVDEIRFDEGNTFLICSHLATVSTARMVISDNASLDFVATNPKAHWESDAFSVPNFTVGNRSDLVVDAATGLVRNAVAHWYPPTSGEAQYDAQGVLTIDADGKLTPIRHNTTEHVHETFGINVQGSVWGDPYGCIYGCCGNYRGFNFTDASSRLDVPNGFLFAGANYAYMGMHDAPHQGIFGASGNPVGLWGFYNYSLIGQTSIRAKIDAPAVSLLSNARVTLYDDHATDSVGLYRLVAGTLSLGGTFVVSNDGSETTTRSCTMNATTFDIGWNATLDVACEGALNAASTISVKSYNGKKGDFGTVNLGYNATVNKMLVDGAELDAGTYGATGSGAENIRDDIFTGTGVLTVTNGEAPAGEKPLVIMFL